MINHKNKSIVTKISYLLINLLSIKIYYHYLKLNKQLIWKNKIKLNQKFNRINKKFKPKNKLNNLQKQQLKQKNKRYNRNM
jgi:hypothetical protein